MVSTLMMRWRQQLNFVLLLRWSGADEGQARTRQPPFLRVRARIIKSEMAPCFHARGLHSSLVGLL